MARLIYSAQALGDFERLTDFLLTSDPKAAAATVGLIDEAQDVVAILAIRHQREAGYGMQDEGT